MIEEEVEVVEWRKCVEAGQIEVSRKCPGLIGITFVLITLFRVKDGGKLQHYSLYDLVLLCCLTLKPVPANHCQLSSLETLSSRRQVGL